MRQATIAGQFSQVMTRGKIAGFISHLPASNYEPRIYNGAVSLNRKRQHAYCGIILITAASPTHTLCGLVRQNSARLYPGNPLPGCNQILRNFQHGHKSDKVKWTSEPKITDCIR